VGCLLYAVQLWPCGTEVAVATLTSVQYLACTPPCCTGLWDAIDAINATPSLDLDFQLSTYERPWVVGEQVEGMWLAVGKDTTMGPG